MWIVFVVFTTIVFSMKCCGRYNFYLLKISYSWAWRCTSKSVVNFLAAAQCLPSCSGCNDRCLDYYRIQHALIAILKVSSDHLKDFVVKYNVVYHLPISFLQLSVFLRILDFESRCWISSSGTGCSWTANIHHYFRFALLGFSLVYVRIWRVKLSKQ